MKHLCANTLQQAAWPKSALKCGALTAVTKTVQEGSHAQSSRKIIERQKPRLLAAQLTLPVQLEVPRTADNNSC